MPHVQRRLRRIRRVSARAEVQVALQADLPQTGKPCLSSDIRRGISNASANYLTAMKFRWLSRLTC